MRNCIKGLSSRKLENHCDKRIVGRAYFQSPITSFPSHAGVLLVPVVNIQILLYKSLKIISVGILTSKGHRKSNEEFRKLIKCLPAPGTQSTK